MKEIYVDNIKRKETKKNLDVELKAYLPKWIKNHVIFIAFLGLLSFKFSIFEIYRF